MRWSGMLGQVLISNIVVDLNITEVDLIDAQSTTTPNSSPLPTTPPSAYLWKAAHGAEQPHLPLRCTAHWNPERITVSLQMATQLCCPILPVMP